MTSVSSIGAWSALVQGNLTAELPTSLPAISTNTSTPPAPGSSVGSLVDLFLQQPAPTSANAAKNLNTSDLYLGMLKLPVVALDNGDDDDS